MAKIFTSKKVVKRFGLLTLTIDVGSKSNGGEQWLNVNIPGIEFPVYVNILAMVAGKILVKSYLYFH